MDKFKGLKAALFLEMRLKRFKKVQTRIVLIVLAAFVFINNPWIPKIMASDWGTIESMQAGRQTGSPLLDVNFNVEEWRPEELAVMGIFLSNFLIPFQDSYLSAFSQTAEYGSKGSAYNALIFSQGQEDSIQPVLDFMVKFVIDNGMRTENLQPIYWKNSEDFVSSGSTTPVDGVGIGGGSSSDPTGMVAPEDSGGEYIAGESTGGSELNADDVVAPEDSGYDENFEVTTQGLGNRATVEDFVNVLESALLAEYFPKPMDGGVRGPTGNVWGGMKIFFVDPTQEGINPKFIFDQTEVYDLNMLTLMVLRCYTYGSSFEQLGDGIIKDDFDAEGLLYLDIFGNIVTLVGEKPIMVLPAACNQHITVTPQYNLLNSIFLGSTYTPARAESLLQYPMSTLIRGVKPSWLEDGDTSGNTYYTSTAFRSLRNFNDIRTLPINTFMLTFDFSTADQYVSGTGSMGTDFKGNRGNNDQYWGEVFYRFLDSDVGDDTSLVGPSVNIVFDDDSNSFAQFFGPSLRMFSGLSLDTLLTESSEIAQRYGDHWDPTAPVLYKIPFQGGLSEVSIFGTPIGTTASTRDNEDSWNHWFDYDRSGRYRSSNVARRFVRYLTMWSRDGIQGFTHIKDSNTLNSYIRSLTDPDMAFKGLIGSSAGLNNISSYFSGHDYTKISPVFQEFVERSGWQKTFDTDYDAGGSVSKNAWIDDLSAAFGRKNIGDPTVGVTGKANNDGSDFDEGAFKDIFKRPLLVLPPSTILLEVSKTLRVDSEVQFVSYTPWLYLAYLEWYGMGGALGDNPLDSVLFPLDNFNVSTSEFENLFISEEDMFNEILKRTYMMLTPGHWFRDSLGNTDMGNFWVRTYNSIVWAGTAAQGVSGGQGGTAVAVQAASAGSAGFLVVDTLQENFFTSEIVRLYTQIALLILALGIAATVIIGLLKRLGIRWVALGIVLAVNVVLLLPAFGDIAPTVTNMMLEKVFEGRLNYWAIMESAENSRLMQDRVMIKDDYGNDMGDEIAMLVDIVQVNHLDRSLMIQQDISRKVTGAGLGNLNELLQWRSTQWILPSILRMYSAEEVNANFVYIPMGDLLQSGTDLWGMLRPDSISLEDYKFEEGGEASEGAGEELQDAGSNWDGYYDVINSLPEEVDIPWVNGVLFHNIKETDAEGNISFESIEVETDDSVRNFYMLSNMTFPEVDFTQIFTQEGKDLIDASVEANVGDAAGAAARPLPGMIKERADALDGSAGTYNTLDPSSVQSDFGFLWMTETSFPFFYINTREIFNWGIPVNTFDSGISGTRLTPTGMVTALIGRYNLAEDPLDSKRVNFMFHGETGLGSDFLNMRDMFYNVIPYMYTVQIMAGGTDGKSGALKDDQISQYTIYNGQPQSWLFRSNWVTKLMEGQKWTQPEEVGGFTIFNPLDPRSYPGFQDGVDVDHTRPMIFSEAERVHYQLELDELTSVELAILDFYNQMTEEWSMFINYASINGISTTVMEEHMALRAMFVFNQIFSHEQMFGENIKLYPSQVGLRHVSFDAVMRVAILNATNDSSFLNGNIVENMLREADFFTAIMLLISAWISLYGLPVVRNLMMAFLFIFGVWGSIRNVLSTGQNGKWALILAYLANIGIFLVYTGMYFIGLSFTMGSGIPQALLENDVAAVEIHSYVMIVFWIFMLSILYFVAAVKHIIFIWKRREDLGAGAMVMGLQTVMDKVSGSVSTSLAGLASSFSGSLDKQNARAEKRLAKKNAARAAAGKAPISAGKGGVIETQESRNRKIEEARRTAQNVETSTKREETTRVSRADQNFTARAESTVKGGLKGDSNYARVEYKDKKTGEQHTAYVRKEIAGSMRKDASITVQSAVDENVYHAAMKAKRESDSPTLGSGGAADRRQQAAADNKLVERTKQ